MALRRLSGHPRRSLDHRESQGGGSNIQRRWIGQPAALITLRGRQATEFSRSDSGLSSACAAFGRTWLSSSWWPGAGSALASPLGPKPLRARTLARARIVPDARVRAHQAAEATDVADGSPRNVGGLNEACREIAARRKQLAQLRQELFIGRCSRSGTVAHRLSNPPARAMASPRQHGATQRVQDDPDNALTYPQAAPR